MADKVKLNQNTLPSPPYKMKKIKIEERLENAVNAFFETGDGKAKNALSFAGHSAVLRNEEQATFAEKGRFWMNIARQMFLFLPGAFLLYFVTLSSVFFIPEFGFTPLMLFWFMTGGFLCLVGLGSLKSVKNLLVPFSIVIFAAVLGLLFSMFPTETRIALNYEYAIYLFPAVLILPKLLQNWITDK